MANTDTRVLTAHIPLGMAEEIDQIAAKLERSKNWIVKQALSAWIDQEALRDKLTHEALSDVDAGNLVSHQSMQVWADSLSSNTPLPPPV
jgi:predicted transcriptional regulator